MDKDIYWARVTEVYRHQRNKGLAKYGFPLEDNSASIVERLNHIEEELVDALMYIEWLKEKYRTNVPK